VRLEVTGDAFWFVRVAGLLPAAIAVCLVANSAIAPARRAA
jgi:hypothetical protein